MESKNPDSPISFDGSKTNHYHKPDAKPVIEEKKRKNNPTAAIAIVVAIIALLCATGSGLVAIMAFKELESAKSGVNTSVSSVDGYYNGNSIEFEETSIAAIAEKVTPAVVSIISTSGSNNSIYSYLYGGGASQSAGTGMIVSKDGYIVTNKHVIEGTREIQVVTDEGTTYDDVDIVGEDPLNDVAYLKINDVDNLPTITLGDSKTIAVGMPVLAIGNALGAYQNSVTNGIVSGTGRSVTAADSDGSNAENLTDMIQTDAAINPGNSGGPLVNAAGEVIGINTAVSTDSNGIGFAIPISAVKGMLKNIMEDGNDSRAYLGVSYINITAEVAKTYDLPVKHGAYVYSERNGRPTNAVAAGGPAEEAGVETGDIITKVGNIEVGNAGSVMTLVGEYKSGETINITILRDGKEKVLTVKLGEYED